MAWNNSGVAEKIKYSIYWLGVPAEAVPRTTGWVRVTLRSQIPSRWPMYSLSSWHKARDPVVALKLDTIWAGKEERGHEGEKKNGEKDEYYSWRWAKHSDALIRGQVKWKYLQVHQCKGFRPGGNVMPQLKITHVLLHVLQWHSYRNKCVRRAYELKDNSSFNSFGVW